MPDLNSPSITTTVARGSAAASPAGTKPGPESKVKSAIQDFEGLLIAQMLQSMRESALGGWQDEKDQSGATALEMAEGQLARLMATQGGLGLSRILEESLQPNADGTSETSKSESFRPAPSSPLSRGHESAEKE